MKLLQTEILYEKEKPEQRDSSRGIEGQSSCQSWARASVRKKSVSMVFKPAVDQRFDGMSKEAVEKDQDRQALTSIQVNRVMGSSRKKELLEELFPNKGEKFTRISDRSKRS